MNQNQIIYMRIMNNLIGESLEDDLGKLWVTFTYNCYITTYYQIPRKN